MPPRADRAPLVVTSVVAIVSCGLLVLAVRLGWLGPDVGRGAGFCERHAGLVRQPANALSNAGFVVAGLVASWQAGRPSFLGTMRPAFATFAASVVVLLGPASAAMHATQSAAGGALDLLSMYLIASLAAAYGWVRWARRGPVALAAAFLAGVVLCELVGLYRRPVPVVSIAGNLAFGALLVVALTFETLLWRRGETRRRFGYGVAALAAMLTAFAVWNLGQHGWCDPHSWLQAHAAWHLLCALAAYLLFRLWASER
jgi:hypothetical protein